MKKGIDYIGGVNYRKLIKKHHPKGWAAGFLCYASGWDNGIKAARTLAKTGKCPVMRIHGLWHDSHHFNENDIPAAVKYAKQVAKLAEDFPDIKFYYSPWLEHRAKEKDVKKCWKKCRKVLPKRVKLVNSGNPMPGKINEVHHGAPLGGRYFFSFDGLSMKDANVSYWKAQHKGSKIFFGWTWACNGKKSKSDKTARADRKAWLTKQELNWMVEKLK